VVLDSVAGNNAIDTTDTAAAAAAVVDSVDSVVHEEVVVLDSVVGNATSEADVNSDEVVAEATDMSSGNNPTLGSSTNELGSTNDWLTLDEQVTGKRAIVRTLPWCTACAREFVLPQSVLPEPPVLMEPGAPLCDGINIGGLQDSLTAMTSSGPTPFYRDGDDAVAAGA
jgi:hypothetical protein